MDVRKRRGILITLVAVLAAVTAAVLVLSITTSTAQQAPPPEAAATPEPAQVPREEVVVAITDIEPNTVLTTAMLTIAPYPVDLVPSDAYTNTNEVVGVTARTKVFGGQMLLKRQLVAVGGRVGSSVNVPRDKVLVAFPSTDILNSTGAIQPGDHVDIMLSLPISGTSRLDAASQFGSQVLGMGPTMVAQTTLQNIEVFSLGYWTPPGAGSSGENGDGAGEGGANQASLKIITFLVDPQEALIVKYIKDSGGVIDLVVRSLEAKQVNDTDPVNIDYLVDLYGFIGLPSTGP